MNEDSYPAFEAIARATEKAKRILDAAYERERYAKATFEERIREKEALERNEALRRHMAFQNSKAKRQWQINPTPENLDAIEPDMISLARNLDLKSKVIIRTKPLPGAVVYYQTKAGRIEGQTPLSFGKITDCTETLPIGRYYVWAQRGATVTSDPERLLMISEPEKEIDLPEDHKERRTDDDR